MAPTIKSTGSVWFWHHSFLIAAAIKYTDAVGETKPGTPWQYIIFIPVTDVKGMLILECNNLSVVPVNLQKHLQSNWAAQTTYSIWKIMSNINSVSWWAAETGDAEMN